MALVLSLGIAAGLATNRLVVTSAGLLYSSRPTLVIGLDNDSVVVTNLASFTRTYPARVADELTTWQRQLAPALPGQLRQPAGD